MPKRFASPDTKIVGSTVSNAADKSSNSRITDLLSSTVFKMLLWTLTSAVSVLWQHLYADWNSSSKPSLPLRWSHNCAATAFSVTFDRKYKFDTGWKFEKSSRSAPLFFNNGLITATLNLSGTWPPWSDKLTIVRVIIGTSRCSHRWNTDHGIGSSAQDFVHRLLT